MVNKKGFLRIVEATIAILLVLSAIILLSSQRTVKQETDLGTTIPSLLDELARNLTFREKIASGGNDAEVKSIALSFLEEKVASPSTNLSVVICNVEEPCYLEPYPDTEQEIFSYERVISGSVMEPNFEPKKIKVFAWRNL